MFRLFFFWGPAFFAAGGSVMAVLWRMIRLGNFSNYLTIGIGLTIVGAIFGLILALHFRFMPVGHLTNDDEIA